MTDAEADSVLAWLANGATVSVPFDAPLFSDDYSFGSLLRRQADGRYALETRFKERPVMSAEEPMQLTSETFDEIELRARLGKAPFAHCSRR